MRLQKSFCEPKARSSAAVTRSRPNACSSQRKRTTPSPSHRPNSTRWPSCKVARWTTALATAVQPALLSSQAYTILDWRVLIFSIGLAVATALVFGVGPAVYASRAGVVSAARSSTPGARHTRTRAVLIATQIAVTITLLTGSIALGRAFLALLSIDNGFEMKSIASLSVSSALWLTAMVANPLGTEMARAAGVEIGFGRWLIAASVPTICAMVLLPVLLYRRGLGGRDRLAVAFYSATALPLVVAITEAGFPRVR